MLSPLVGQVILAVYAAMLAVGGVAGYVHAGSKPSLVAGLGTAVVALAAMFLSFQQNRLGLMLGLVLAVAMSLFFGYRYLAKGRKFMPAGLMVATSLIVLLILAVSLV
jgi:uncharacterized membrane protein (UPF0136 family)